MYRYCRTVYQYYCRTRYLVYIAILDFGAPMTYTLYALRQTLAGSLEQ